MTNEDRPPVSSRLTNIALSVLISTLVIAFAVATACTSPQPQEPVVNLGALAATAVAPVPTSTPTPIPTTTTQFGGDETPFELDWTISTPSITSGETFTLTIRMHDLKLEGEHGGISVSFPTLTQPGGDQTGYSSPYANIQAISYTTGLSQVTFHQPGATIYHRIDNEQFPASHLLVESDDPTWSITDDRTLILRITPKQQGEFPLRVRGWLCHHEYTNCERNPDEAVEYDQQGWVAKRLAVFVSNPQ